jgi:hypothetical protein
VEFLWDFINIYLLPKDVSSLCDSKEISWQPNHGGSGEWTKLFRFISSTAWKSAFYHFIATLFEAWELTCLTIIYVRCRGGCGPETQHNILFRYKRGIDGWSCISYSGRNYVGMEKGTFTFEYHNCTQHKRQVYHMVTLTWLNNKWKQVFGSSLLFQRTTGSW